MAWGNLPSPGLTETLGALPSTRVLWQVCWGWWDHEASGVPAPGSLALVTAALLLSVIAKWRLGCFVQSQRCCFSDHLAAVIFKCKYYNWNLDHWPLFWDGFKCVFLQELSGFGVALVVAGCCLAKKMVERKFFKTLFGVWCLIMSSVVTWVKEEELYNENSRIIFLVFILKWAGCPLGTIGPVWLNYSKIRETKENYIVFKQDGC